MHCLQESDLRIIEMWKSAEGGVLQPLDGHRIHRARTIIVTCSDPFRFQDIYGHHRTLCSEVVPPLALFGGALLLAEASPLVRDRGDDHVLVHHIGMAIEHLGVDTVVLYGHAPCKAAQLEAIGLDDQARFLVSAKSRLRKRFPGVNLACFFHVDPRPHRAKMKTYFFNRKSWEGLGRANQTSGSTR